MASDAVRPGIGLQAGNLFDALPDASSAEVFTTLLARQGWRVERIVSQGQVSPPGFWYDSPQHEWVLLLSGGAALRLEGEAQARTLRVGDWLYLPAHCRHRVEWTDPSQPSVWLAIHAEPGGQPDPVNPGPDAPAHPD